MAPSGLRQRKSSTNKNPPSSETKKETRRSKRTATSALDPAKDARTRNILILILIIYVPILAVVNPSTIPKWFAFFFPPVCEGVCQVEASNNDNCSPLDTDRLVFVRIPKTASSSLLQLFAAQRRKATAAVDLGELEDVVASLTMDGISDQTAGAHDPKTRTNRLRSFYKQASKQILYPPFSNQLRTLFQGHLHYFDFEAFVPLYFPNTTTVLPDWLLDLYSRKYPQSPLTIPQFTVLRNPQLRLASMYHYDRVGARTAEWRNAFVGIYGNQTLEECLMNSSTCVSENDLSRWCNVQTELLCGTDCPRGDSDEALAKAKIAVREKLFFVGIVERLPASLQLLSKRIPTYLEDVSHMPHVKESGRRQLSDASVVERLNELCRFDQELYDYADELLTQRLEECNIE